MRARSFSWVSAVGFGLVAIACGDPGAGGAASEGAAAIEGNAPTGTLQNCGFVLVEGDAPLRVFDHFFEDEVKGTVEPGSYFPIDGETRNCFKVYLDPNNFRSGVCIRKKDVPATCPADVDTRKFVALRDTHLVTGLPLSAAAERACAIPTGTLIGATGWGTGGDTPDGYMSVTLDDESLPGCAQRKGFLVRDDVATGKFYYGEPTPALTRLNERRRAAGERGVCEAPQAPSGDACATVRQPVRCPQLTVPNASGDNCVALDAAARGFAVNDAVVVKAGLAGGWWESTVTAIDGQNITVRSILQRGPYRFETTERTFPQTEVERTVRRLDSLEVGATFVTIEGDTRRIRRIDTLTDLGSVKLTTTVITGARVDPNPATDNVSLADALRLLEGAARVTTDFRPGEPVAYAPAVFGEATVVEEGATTVRVAYTRNAGGRLIDETADVAKTSLAHYASELQGVKAGAFYFAKAGSTLVAEVKRIRANGDLLVTLYDDVAHTGSSRVLTIGAFVADYAITP
jgi:hypothetical protein